jgi:hypothetical protein
MQVICRVKLFKSIKPQKLRLAGCNLRAISAMNIIPCLSKKSKIESTRRLMVSKDLCLNRICKLIFQGLRDILRILPRASRGAASSVKEYFGEINAKKYIRWPYRLVCQCVAHWVRKYN